MPLWFESENEKEFEEYSEVENLEDGVWFEHIGVRSGHRSELPEDPDCGMFLFGDPETDKEYWHEQSEANAAPIACHRMIAEQIFQEDLSEHEILDCAKKKGYYNSEYGISANDIDKLFREYGLAAELDFDVSVMELAEMLDQNGKVICLINDFVLACPEAADLYGISPNHAVQVIGMDLADLQQGKVILNNPGDKRGRCAHYDLGRFLKSWRTGGCLTVSVHGRYGDDDTGH